MLGGADELHNKCQTTLFWSKWSLCAPLKLWQSITIAMVRAKGEEEKSLSDKPSGWTFIVYSRISKQHQVSSLGLEKYRKVNSSSPKLPWTTRKPKGIERWWLDPTGPASQVNAVWLCPLGPSPFSLPSTQLAVESKSFIKCLSSTSLCINKGWFYDVIDDCDWWLLIMIFTVLFLNYVYLSWGQLQKRPGCHRPLKNK